MLKADKQVKDQAILRFEEMSARRKINYKIPQGEGNIVTGSIFDVNRYSFQQALTDYFDRLYLGWNPFKNEGRGCWEVWQRPSQKTAIIAYESPEKLPSGKPQMTIVKTEYRPNDYEHWVDDLEFLSYDFIGKLRRMDAWANKRLTQEHDEAYENHKTKLEAEESENIRYVVRHNKQAFRDLLDYTQQGINPLDFFTKNLK